MSSTPTFPSQPIKVLTFVSGSALPANVGQLTYVSGSGLAVMQDDGIAYIRSGNISAIDHSQLRQLVHLAEEGGPFEGFAGAVKDTAPGPFPTGSVWWTDSSRTQKIVEKVIVRNANKTPATVQWKAYASGSNAVAASFTDTITYSGVFETSRTRTSP